jgi:ketosteroid isomerase-like protein
MPHHEPARRPDDLGRLFIERANAGDVDGLVALYEPEALLALADGSAARGAAEIRAFFEQLVDGRPVLALGDQQPSLVTGELALTSTRLVGGGATAEIARRRPDGSWRWIADQPNL